jgi:hypothetical protein
MGHRRRGIEGQDLSLERGKEVVGGCTQGVSAAADGETLDAVADLGERDRCRVQLAAVRADPVANYSGGGWLHELGCDVGVDDDHGERSAARTGVARGGSSSSTPPISPKRSSID